MLRTYLQIGAYHSTPRYLNLGGFLDFACSCYSGQVSSLDELGAYFQFVRSEKYLEDGDSRDQFARRLVREDLNAIECQLKDLSQDTLSLYMQPKQHIFEVSEVARCSLQRWLPDYTIPQIHFVDKLPAPFDNQQHHAMNIDHGDFVNYGIEPGVYFLNSKLRPVYSAYLYLHELGHVILGRRSPEELAFGLEEGICELLGAFFLAFQCFSPSTVRNLFLLNRHFGSNSRHWEYYRHNTRVLAPLLARYGWQFVFFVLRGGRAKLKQIEDAVYSGNWTIPELDETNLSDDVGKVLSSLLADNDTYVLSARAFYVARFVTPGITLRELATVCAIGEDDVREALDELSQAFSLVTMRTDGTVVTYSDCHRLIKLTGIVRYVI